MSGPIQHRLTPALCSSAMAVGLSGGTCEIHSKIQARVQGSLRGGVASGAGTTPSNGYIYTSLLARRYFTPLLLHRTSSWVRIHCSDCRWARPTTANEPPPSLLLLAKGVTLFSDGPSWPGRHLSSASIEVAAAVVDARPPFARALRGCGKYRRVSND